MSQTPNKSDYSLIIRRAQQYIGENIYEKLSVNALAKHLYVHPNYLSNLFRKETGQSVTEYILQNKIKESQNMLSYSKNTVTDISNFLGFSSQSHFGLAFRKVTGVTPVQYRKLHFREY